MKTMAQKRHQDKLKIALEALLSLVILYAFTHGFLAWPHTISGLAYDDEPLTGYTVYIEEGGIYTPYLVLTNDYNGETLLLRKEVMSENRMLNFYYSYYENSFIDNYLNTEFLELLNPHLQDIVVNSTIIITEKDRTDIGKGWYDKLPMEIERKVFLLAMSEIGIKVVEGVMNVEGKSLKYFWLFPHTRIAYTAGQPQAWMLRTTNNAFAGDISHGSVGPEAEIGSGAAVALGGCDRRFV
jgi:hypothetical protein